jgi:DNA-binding XRE family transcriptional regulator
MNAEVMHRVRVEVPNDSLQLVSDLVRKLGGRLLKNDCEEEIVFVSPPVPEPDRVGRMLKGARVRAGMTQKQLASVIGVPQSHISEYEKNKRRIPQAKADELAKVLKTVPTHFMYRD